MYLTALKIVKFIIQAPKVNSILFESVNKTYSVSVLNCAIQQIQFTCTCRVDSLFQTFISLQAIHIV